MFRLIVVALAALAVIFTLLAFRRQRKLRLVIGALLQGPQNGVDLSRRLGVPEADVRYMFRRWNRRGLIYDFSYDPAFVSEFRWSSYAPTEVGRRVLRGLRWRFYVRISLALLVIIAGCAWFLVHPQ